ncbi:MAG TPA: YbaN family protein [Turneriella sp.]|nr:YbaN family protein [Turneriella sp.]
MAQQSADNAPLKTPKVDESLNQDSRLASASWVRLFFVLAGSLSLALGIIGIVTPILPTTPFILLSGFCFARGSTRFHKWILNHKYFGPMIHAFYHEKRIPLFAKITATMMIASTMTATAFIVRKPIPIIGMATVGCGVLIYIWSFKN